MEELIKFGLENSVSLYTIFPLPYERKIGKTSIKSWHRVYVDLTLPKLPNPHPDPIL